jgi:hypothetical protein
MHVFAKMTQKYVKSHKVNKPKKKLRIVKNNAEKETLIRIIKK